MKTITSHTAATTAPAYIASLGIRSLIKNDPRDGSAVISLLYYTLQKGSNPSFRKVG